jgi:glucose/mannose-6-phosphate isomerase
MNRAIPKEQWHAADPNMKMFRWITRLPDQIRKSAELWPNMDAGSGPRSGILFAGMGGSAMAARVATLAYPSTLPTMIVCDEQVPGWLDNRWLFVACSYSGNTRETLLCLDQATERGCTIAAISSGGRLQELCHQRGYRHRELVPGQPPRTALGQAVVGILWILWVHGLMPDPRPDIAETASITQSLMAEGLLADDPWRTDLGAWAQRIVEGFSLAVGAGMTSVAALRWVQQLNENAKLPAFFLEIPEMLHNQIEALPAAKDAGAHLVVLGDKSQTDAQRSSIEALVGSSAFAGSEPWRVESIGESPMARIFSLMCRGDQLSYLAALYRGVDPTPVERINEFKRILAGG